MFNSSKIVVAAATLACGLSAPALADSAHHHRHGAHSHHAARAHAHHSHMARSYGDPREDAPVVAERGPGIVGGGVVGDGVGLGLGLADAGIGLGVGAVGAGLGVADAGLGLADPYAYPGYADSYGPGAPLMDEPF